MGSIQAKPGDYRRHVEREMATYMDQQRWLAQYNEQSWRVVHKRTVSPARKRGELRAIVERQGNARASYNMIAYAQRRIGLWSEQGDNHG